MRLLQRYILGELLRVFLFIITVLTVLLLGVGAFRVAGENGLGVHQIVRILPYLVPSMLPYTIPSTLLLTVCVVYGRISGDLEVTAAKAAGINVLSLLKPAFLVGIALSVSSFVLTDRIIPWAEANIQRVATQAMEDIFLDVLRTQRNYSDEQRGFSVTVDRVVGRRLLDVTISKKYGSSGSWGTIHAREAMFDFDLENEQMRLHVGDVQGSIPGRQASAVGRGQHIFSFPLPREIRKPKPRHLSVTQIQDQIVAMDQQRDDQYRDLEVASAMVLATGDFGSYRSGMFLQRQKSLRSLDGVRRKFQTEMHSRYALSASCLFFVLLGGPFAIMQGTRQFLTSFVICFVPVLVVYYPLTFLSINLSRSGAMQPSIAMWFANGVLLVGALYCLYRVLRT